MTRYLNRREFLGRAAGCVAAAGALSLNGCKRGSQRAAKTEGTAPGNGTPHEMMAVKVSPRKLPYPRSKLFSGLEWTGEPSKYPGTASDMHWCTWGTDDALYVVDDDGSNFGQKYEYADGTWTFGHLLRVTGVPPHHHIDVLYTFEKMGVKGKYPDRILRYPGGTVAVGSRLYVILYDYDHKLDDGPLLGMLGIVYTDDAGKSWHNVPDKDSPYFLGPRFAAPEFIGFGPGYSGVPSDLDGYLYGISVDYEWETGNHLFLSRVPKDRVIDRSSWEFFGGEGEGHMASRAVWTKSEDKAQPIFSDSGHTGHSDMVYVPALKRFLLSVFSDVVAHTYNLPPEVAKKTWDVHTELQIYEGPSPWGPWALVHDERPWGGQNHAAYLPHIPSKWLSKDGLSGTLLFSGDWVFYKQWYGFMTQPFRLARAHGSGK